MGCRVTAKRSASEFQINGRMLEILWIILQLDSHRTQVAKMIATAQMLSHMMQQSQLCMKPPVKMESPRLRFIFMMATLELVPTQRSIAAALLRHKQRPVHTTMCCLPRGSPLRSPLGGFEF